MSGHMRSCVASLADGTPQPSQGPWTVHGVALGAETTVGKYGKRRWESAALKQAAASLEGVELSRLHEDEAVPVGRVTSATFDAELGVCFEAECGDYKTAAALSNGTLGVSIEAAAPDDDAVSYDDDGAVVWDEFEFKRLAAVEKPASKSAHVSPGPMAANPGIAALGSEESVNAAVRAALGKSDDGAIQARKRQWISENLGFEL